MNKKNCILIIFLLFAHIACYTSETKMEIILNHKNDQILCYTGKPIITIMKKLESARPALDEEIVKAAIPEGTYRLILYNENQKKEYIIQNSFWIYSSEDKQVLACDILNELRDKFILFMLSEERKKNDKHGL